VALARTSTRPRRAWAFPEDDARGLSARADVRRADGAARAAPGARVADMVFLRVVTPRLEI